jgi:hypothetical protein
MYQAAAERVEAAWQVAVAPKAAVQQQQEDQQAAK